MFPLLDTIPVRCKVKTCQEQAFSLNTTGEALILKDTIKIPLCGDVMAERPYRCIDFCVNEEERHSTCDLWRVPASEV